ncbi:MAG: hypothetical protein JWN40_1398 [Phycisphaerales bacterium]|nr:hypothetical protein [Phycisphaerales bacterium]
MRGNTLYALAFLAIVAIALALRVPNLAQRPMHNDEGVNAVKFNQLWTSGTFEYDPNEYHGPTLYYFTLPVVWISGAKDFAATSEVTYRMVAVIFGMGLILLLPLVGDGIGRGGVLWAALFTAVSPAFVFYSRYYIHEMPLIFFMFAAIACGWRYRRSNRLGWAIACGTFLGLTYATKETWVLALAAAAGSGVAAATIWRFLLKRGHHGLHFRWRAVGVGLAAFAIVFVCFFSGFFTRWRGVADAVMTYVHYSQRSSGSVHDHAWNYYLSILTWWRVKPGPVWSEAAIVALAAVGFLMAVFRRHTAPLAAIAGEASSRQPARFTAFPPFVRFVGFYAIFLVVQFSVIPYKTPWCLLGFLHGMILLAGFAAGQIVHLVPGITAKVGASIVLLAAAAQLAWQADRATNNFADPKHPNYFAASRYNPYVYAHTGTDVGRTLLPIMDQAAAASPKGKQMLVQVVAGDCWPLPFYLRGFANVGYWPAPPTDLGDPDVVIGTDEVGERLAGPAANPRYIAKPFGLRPGVVLYVYVKENLWKQLGK